MTISIYTAPYVMHKGSDDRFTISTTQAVSFTNHIVHMLKGMSIVTRLDMLTYLGYKTNRQKTQYLN